MTRIGSTRFGVVCAVGISLSAVLLGLAVSGGMATHAQGGGQAASEPTAAAGGAPAVSPGAGTATRSEEAAGLQWSESVSPVSVGNEPHGTLPANWYSVAGAVFLPANSGYSYQYGSSGCIKSNSPGYWRAVVNLPDGSVAKYIEIGYKNDMYSGNSTAWLTGYKYDGVYRDVALVNSRTYTSTATTGYFIDLSGEFTETIDNLSYAYTFIWSGSTTQRLCSLRVAYIPPSVFGVALPAVLRQAP